MAEVEEQQISVQELEGTVNRFADGHDDLCEQVKASSDAITEASDANMQAFGSRVDARDSTVKKMLAARSFVDAPTQFAVLEKLDDMERNQQLLEEQMLAKHEEDIKVMKKKVEELEKDIEERKRQADIERMMAVASNAAPIMMSVNTEAFDAVGDAAADAQFTSATRAEDANKARKYAEADVKAANNAAISAAAAALAANQALEALEALKEFVDKRQAPPIERIEREQEREKMDPNKVVKKAKFDLNTIEAIMMSHPAVHGALAWVTKDEKGDSVVHCAVEPKKGARTSEKWLRLHAQTILPAMQVPRKFHLLDKLPASREEAEKCPDVYAAYCTPKPERLAVRGPSWKYTPPNPDEEDIPANRPKKRLF
eukprot:CAMPEP_0184692356 /NCGR_PEP_ID=MMETSP0313-20130426/872_1 /TAXON_ID=2792 /ORGANISM="Porphyridium aerugineum, Strain SAG 1380-2" /LENGTH=370 /DNA_ID=CAMNT_0027150183 /DNA_START=120 /DNA_END=1232 /DNA_ORIENTATION=+